jgi:hypothetical protein
MIILHETKQEIPQEKQEVRKQQTIHIPGWWYSNLGTYSRITRNIQVLGTVEIREERVNSKPERVEYGQISWDNKVAIVVQVWQGATLWEGAEYRNKPQKGKENEYGPKRSSSKIRGEPTENNGKPVCVAATAPIRNQAPGT